MRNKILISLGIAALMSITTQVYANSTIYTDDLGRLHFLGKDPGAKTLQKIEDYVSDHFEAELECVDGKQPVYSFIVGVE